MSSAAANVVNFPGGSRWDYRRGTPNRRYGLPDGDPGIAKTIQFMRALARGNEGASNPIVRQKALEIVRGIDPHDKQAQAAAILDWVKQNIEFRGEYQELLQSPVVTLQLGAGDCDDHSQLIAALLKTLGFNARFATVAADPEDPTQFTHVFCEVLDPTTGQWTALDSTVKESYPGWRPANVYREKSWSPMGGMGEGYVSAPNGVEPSLQTDIFETINPIAQAVGYRIAGVQPASANINFGNPFSPTSPSPTIAGIPWWGVGLLLLGALYVMRRN